jgi:hypothetical protein
VVSLSRLFANIWRTILRAWGVGPCTNRMPSTNFLLIEVEETRCDFVTVTLAHLTTTMSDRKRALEGNGESGIAKKLKRSDISRILASVYSFNLFHSDSVSPILFVPQGELLRHAIFLTRLYNLVSTLQTLSNGSKPLATVRPPFRCRNKTN